MLDQVRAVADKLMQASNLDEGQVWPWEVEVAEKAERRVPGDRFPSDTVFR